MASWNIDSSGNQLTVDLVPNSGDVQERNYTYVAPSTQCVNGEIKLFESGNYKQTLTLSQIGTIAGDTPTDIYDAEAKIKAIIANFNGGGETPLSEDIIAALEGATSPSAGNPFATVDDVVTTVPYKAEFTSDGSNPQTFTIPANTYVTGVANGSTGVFYLPSDWNQDSAGDDLTLNSISLLGDVIEVIGETYTATPNPVVRTYAANLTQSGTDDPVATVIYNTLGGTVVWSRASNGRYLGTLAGAFGTKSIAFCNGTADGEVEAYSTFMANDTILIYAQGFVDENAMNVQITVYP